MPAQKVHCDPLSAAFCTRISEISPNPFTSKNNFRQPQKVITARHAKVRRTMTGIQARTVTNGTIGKTACQSPYTERTREAIHQPMCVGRRLVATPGHMLVRADDEEGMGLSTSGPGPTTPTTLSGIPQSVAAAPIGRTSTRRSVQNNRVPGPNASYGDRPSSSQTCRSLQPGAIDGVSPSIEYAGAALPS